LDASGIPKVEDDDGALEAFQKIWSDRNSDPTLR
jgi:hypothetical protein